MANKEIFLNSGVHKAELPKGTFDKSFRNHLTAKVGYLYPCLVEEAVADSTYHIRPDMVFDLMPMAMPLQCRMRAHVSIFNVPFRILMKNFKDYFSRVGNHAMPYISREDDWVTPGSLADYMGVPTAQFSESQAVRNTSFSQRGFFSPSNFEVYSLEDFSERHFLLSNNLSSVVTNNGTFHAVLSAPLEYPFSGNSFDMSVFCNQSIARPNLNLFFLAGPNENTQYVLSMEGASTGGVFPSVITNPQPVGTYKVTSSQNVLTISNDVFVVQNLHFIFSESYLAPLNSLITREGWSVRLLVCCPSSSSYLGVGFSSQFYDVEELMRTVRTLSTFTIKPGELVSYEPSVSSVSTSTVLSSFSYPALFGDVELSRHYFNVVEGEPPLLPINALAFRAYEFIYNKYFRNLQVDKFYINGEPSYNVYITNDGDGADSTTPVELKRVPYEYDVFTTALPSPQMGYAPLVGVTTNNASGTGILHMIPLVDGQPDPSQAYDIAVSYNSENGDVTAISNYEEVANKASVARLQEAIDFGISINDLRNVSAFQRLKEKMMKAGYEYQSLMEEFFGTTPPIGEEFPEYLGGFTREIKIGKIQNTALTSEHPLGEFAGVGGVAGSSRTIKVFVKEPSYIMGVLWFSVTPTYSQMLPKHFLKFHPLDYFNPTFNAIGPQPIHTHEIAPLQLPPEELNKVFGYQRPWYDYVSRVDECHGEFRTSMRHYLLQRLFAVAPELTANFINIHSEELTDIFTYTVDTDKFFGYIDFDIKCKSPVARVSVPRIIG